MLYPDVHVRRFIANVGLFALLLEDGTILKYEPEDPEAYRRYLIDHGAGDLSPSPDGSQADAALKVAPELL